MPDIRRPGRLREFLNNFGGTSVVGNNITFTNNTCFNLGTREGFTVASPNLINVWFWTNVTCTGNIVHDVTGIQQTSTYGIAFEGCDGGIVSNNLVHDIGATWVTGGGGTGPFGVEILSCRGVVVANNVVYNVFVVGNIGGGLGIQLDNFSQGCTLKNNYVFNCYGPGIRHWPSSTSSGGNTIAYNAIVNCATFSAGYLPYPITIGDSGQGGDGSCNIYGNTIISTVAAPAIYFGAGCTKNKVVANNVLIAPNGSPSIIIASTITTPFTLDGNYHQSGPGGFLANLNSTDYTTLAAWRTATSREASSVGAGDIKFPQLQPPPIPTTPPIGAAIPQTSAFAPLSASPLIGGGVSLTGLSITPGNDILGNAWSQNCIGAFYATGSPMNAYAVAVDALNPIIRLRLAEPVGSTAGACDSVPGIPALVWTSITPGGPNLCPVDAGTSYSFDGIASVARSPAMATPYVFASAFSLEAWMEPTTIAIANQVMCNFRNGTSDAISLILNNNLLRFLIKDATNTLQAHPTSYLVAANAIIHVVCVWGGSNTLVVYVNAASQALTYDNSNTPVNPQITALNLGTQGALSRYYQGYLGPVNAYASALTAPQVAALYAAGTTFPSGSGAGSGVPLMMGM